MTFKCKNCTHNNVCKHQESYKKTLDSMNTKIPTPFSISLECPFYSSASYVCGPSLWGTVDYANTSNGNVITTLECINGTDTVSGTSTNCSSDNKESSVRAYTKNK